MRWFMFQEKFRKAVSILLIVCMTICSNGFTTLAQGDSGVFDDAHKGGSQNNPTNYYYQYQQELAGNGQIFGDGNNSVNDDNGGNGGEEKENIVLDGEDSGNKQNLDAGNTDSSDNSVGKTDDASEGDKENQNNNKENEGDGEISPDNFGDDSNKSKNDYADEPEEDATDKTQSDTDSTKPSSEEPEEGTSEEEGTTTAEETTKESTTAEETTTVEKTTEESTTVEQSSTEESTTLETTTTIEQTSETTTTETTTNNNIDQTTKGNTSTESETTNTDVAPEEATESETTKTETEKEATESEADKITTTATDSEAEQNNLSDLISTESEMKLVKSTESNVIIKTITRYVKATKSEVATKSQWKVKSLLSDLTQESGAIMLKSTKKEDLEKYMAPTVKVLLVDQYGNEKVVRVKADWDFDVVDLQIEQSVKQYNEKLEARKKEEENSDNTAISISDVNIENATDDKKLDGERVTIKTEEKSSSENVGANVYGAQEENTTKEVVMEYVGEVVDTNIDINEANNDKKAKDTIASSSKADKDIDVKAEVVSANENNDNDMIVSKVVYEYVDVVVEGDTELANENDLKPEKMIVGNADNKTNTKDMPHAIYPRLNKEKLLENISKVMALEERKEAETDKKPVYLSTEVTDEKIVNEDEYNATIEEKKLAEDEQNNNSSTDEDKTTDDKKNDENTNKETDTENNETVAGFTNTDEGFAPTEGEGSPATDGEGTDNTGNNTDGNGQGTEEPGGVTIDLDEDFEPYVPPIFGGTSHTGSHPECAYPGHLTCSGHFTTGAGSARLSSHGNRSFTAWSTVLDSMGAKSSGVQSYALTANLTIDKKVTIVGNCYICLNGNTLTFGNKGYFELAAPVTSDSLYNFYICDCAGGSKITSEMATYWPDIAGGEGWGSKKIGGVSVKKSGIYRAAESVSCTGGA